MIKSKSQLDNECSNRIKSVLPELQIDVDGTACRTMMEAFTAPIADCYLNIEELNNSYKIYTAHGSQLDEKGRSRNIYRGVGEDDTNYRDRIINFMSESNRTNIAYMMREINKLSGIAQVIYKPFAVGLGSFVVYLVPTGNVISSDTWSAASNIINTNIASGCRGIVRNAIVLSVQMKINLIFTKSSNSTSDNSITIKTLCVSSINQYINSLQAGDPLILDEIITRCKNVSSLISYLTFDYIRINGKIVLARNYYPQEFEVIRPAVNTAIVIA